MGDTINDTPFKVSIGFSDATIQIDSKNLESMIAAKAEADHQHYAKDIQDWDTKINTALTDYVKKESNSNGDVNLGTGTLTCKDTYFTYNGSEISLTEMYEKYVNKFSTTIEHLTLTYDSNIKVGYPVFFTGEVASRDFTPIIISSTDCVPLVKSTGDETTFAGICTEVDVSHDNSTTKYYNCKKCAFIRFATHGDFLMAVDDNSKYKVGDLIAYDGNIVDTNEPLPYKTQMSIVGSVTALVNNNTVAVFRI